MKLTFSALIAALILAQNAFATVTETQNYSVPVTAFDGLNFSCHPGVAPNGHNYPTPSSAHIVIYGFVPTYNITTVSSNGPSGMSNKLGNHCAELEESLRAQIPGTLNLTRTLEESCELSQGQPVRRVTESITATIGSYEFTESRDFVTGSCTVGN
jgi:hypothetical protein